MKQTLSKTMNQFVVLWQHTLSSTMKLAFAVLCGLLLTSGALAQEQQTEMPPAPAEKPLNPNEALTPAPLANQVMDGDIVFTSPGQFTYPRDIRLSDNFGGLRFYGANQLTTSPAGAAIQFFGNNSAPYHGQLYLDSGAHNNAALIFRTAQTGGTITERMRVRAFGQVLIGTTNSTQNAALHVVNNNGATGGVVGESSHPNGYGVIGRIGTSTGAGVQGESTGSSTGVVGRSNSGNGVFGRSNSSGNGVEGWSETGTGVFGRSPFGFAGYFQGDVGVNGRLTKSSGSFKIDHPLDPTNKYLSHSFVESPDMMNIYNGIVTLDRRGRAVVTMPEWSDALNKDFRYQLTPIGGFAPLYVAKKLKGNRFQIAGGRRGMEVSWQVTGVRQDAYAEQHRIKVEEDKPAAERGTYLNPEAFGQPAEKGVAHVRQPTSTPQPKEENRAARLPR